MSKKNVVVVRAGLYKIKFNPFIYQNASFIYINSDITTLDSVRGCFVFLDEKMRYLGKCYQTTEYSWIEPEVPATALLQAWLETL